MPGKNYEAIRRKYPTRGIECLADRIAFYDPDTFDAAAASGGRDYSIVDDCDLIRPWRPAPGKIITGLSPMLWAELKRRGITNPDREKKSRRLTRKEKREKRNAHPVAKGPASV